jgi:hypothetical protein
MKFLKEVEAARKSKLLRESLCREGTKAQEQRLWKPSILPAKFWMQRIDRRAFGKEKAGGGTPAFRK